MGKMLIIMISDAASANEPNITPEIINMDIHFVESSFTAAKTLAGIYLRTKWCEMFLCRKCWLQNVWN